jgi:hypothetical protein
MNSLLKNICLLALTVVLSAGCGNSPGPNSIMSHPVQAGTPITDCTAVCHNATSTISPDPLVTNGSGTFGKHIAHVSLVRIPCQKCHFNYMNHATHMNGRLDTPDPAVLIVYFDGTNPTGAWINDIGPSTGSCTSLRCHGTDTLDWYGTNTANFQNCVSCHSFALGPRRAILGAGGDFGGNGSVLSHHVSGTADPVGEQCLVCHDQSTHTTGTVRLRNADTGASIAYDPAAPEGLEPFCLSCHDADGALSTAASGGTTTSPFNDGSTLGSPPYSFAMRIASSWSKSFGHGPKGNHPAGSKLTCLGTGQPGTGCHGSGGKINAHGSTSEVLAAQNYTYSQNTVTYVESDFALCFNCHGSYSGFTKEDLLSVKFGGILDSDYGILTGPNGYHPPYYRAAGVTTHFADHNDPLGSPLNDFGVWVENANLHWFHLGAPTAFRGTAAGSGVTCVNCHDVHGSDTTYGAVYDELAYSNTSTLGNIYGQMTLDAYNTDLLGGYPTYCSFNCHVVQGPSRAWFYPINE